jgi:hypothetical protein
MYSLQVWPLTISKSSLLRPGKTSRDWENPSFVQNVVKLIPILELGE